MTDRIADGVLKARRFAMDALARREHSQVELERKLAAKWVGVGRYSTSVDNDLKEDGLLSDTRFAEALCHSWARRGKGPLRIRADLKTSGGLNPID